MKRFVWPAETKTLSHANDDGPWEASFPEEGDVIDQSVFICHADMPEYEVIEMMKGSLAFKISWAKRLARLMNTVGADIHC